MPEPRTVEEWAGHCEAQGHLEAQRDVRALCLACARAYARQVVARWNDAPSLSARHPIRDIRDTFHDETC